MSDQRSACRKWFEQIDTRVTQWMAEYGVVCLRISLGSIFFWFGALKFFPGASPAQDLATRTIEWLTFGNVDPTISLSLLALWECVIGIGLIAGIGMRFVLLLLFIQMLGTLTPIVVFPQEVFITAPFILTLEGQYIIKNFILLSAAMVLGATVRGGKLIADPDEIKNKII